MFLLLYYTVDICSNKRLLFLLLRHFLNLYSLSQYFLIVVSSELQEAQVHTLQITLQYLFGAKIYA